MIALAVSFLVACHKEIITDPTSPENSGIVSNKCKDEKGKAKDDKDDKDEVKKKVVNIKGTLAGTSQLAPSANCPSGLLNIGMGTGKSDHFGKFNFSNADCYGSPFNTTFLYPNGDKVYSSQVGQFIDPATGYIVQDAVFTSGTGKFAGVTGSSRLYITQFLPAGPPGLYNVKGFFEGTLILIKNKDNKDDEDWDD